MSSSDDAVDPELRQARLSRFGRVLAFIALAFAALIVFTSSAVGKASFLLGNVPLAVAAVAFGSLWLLLRGRPRTPRFVRTVELATLFVGTGAFSSMAMVMDLTASPDMGAVGYWLLTGTHVFSGTSIVEVCAHHLHSAPEPPSVRLRAPVPPDLEAVILACLAKRPEERPASAHVLRERLAACTDASAWTNARAAAWWSAHRHELRSGGAKGRAPSTTGDRRSPHLTVTRITE